VPAAARLRESYARFFRPTVWHERGNRFRRSRDGVAPRLMRDQYDIAIDGERRANHPAGNIREDMFRLRTAPGPSSPMCRSTIPTPTTSRDPARCAISIRSHARESDGSQIPVRPQTDRYFTYDSADRRGSRRSPPRSLDLGADQYKDSPVFRFRSSSLMPAPC
jgi:hypothetical protein